MEDIEKALVRSWSGHPFAKVAAAPPRNVAKVFGDSRGGGEAHDALKRAELHALVAPLSQIRTHSHKHTSWTG